MTEPDWAMLAAAEEAVADALRAEMDTGEANCLMEYLAARKRAQIFLARASSEAAT